MSLFVVTEKASGSEVTRYVAIAATESVGYSFADFDHAETPEAPEQPVVVDPALWRIDVGSFFDRFGDAKLAILASENTIVKAMITDASVRKYISLIERKDELTQGSGCCSVCYSRAARRPCHPPYPTAQRHPVRLHCDSRCPRRLTRSMSAGISSHGRNR